MKGKASDEHPQVFGRFFVGSNFSLIVFEMGRFTPKTVGVVQLLNRLFANGLLYKPTLTPAEVLLKERLESRETQRQERMMNRWVVISRC